MNPQLLLQDSKDFPSQLQLRISCSLEMECCSTDGTGAHSTCVTDGQGTLVKEAALSGLCLVLSSRGALPEAQSP
jgi:hypothetical protein